MQFSTVRRGLGASVFALLIVGFANPTPARAQIPGLSIPGLSPFRGMPAPARMALRYAPKVAGRAFPNANLPGSRQGNLYSRQYQGYGVARPAVAPQARYYTIRRGNQTYLQRY